ncbi:MAG: anti-sigma factor family protein [Chitinophagaceae bacterium]
MNITRHNYEEYFVLYLDNELSSADRRQVELFVQENADLKQELDWMLQSRLVPDTSVVFDNKEQLMMVSGTFSINTTNYEEWLLLYTDNELTAEQKIAVEQFTAAHPVVKTELDILQKTKLQAEEGILFANKEILYRREEKVQVIAIRWWKIAVAAALLTAIATTAFIVFNNKSDERIISDKSIDIKVKPENSENKQKAGTTALANSNTIVTDDSTDRIQKEKVGINNPVAVTHKKNISPKEKNTRPSNYIIKEEKPDVANTKSERKKTNDLPQPLYNPNVNKAAEQNNPLAKNDITDKGSLTNPKENIHTPVVTPDNSQPLDYVIAAASKVPDDPIDAGQPGRKNKLRGIFRKITRTFEKNTNIKATGDEDRLLLGGLAIKL